MVSVIHGIGVQLGAFRPVRQLVVTEGIVQFQVTGQTLHHPLLLRKFCLALPGLFLGGGIVLAGHRQYPYARVNHPVWFFFRPLDDFPIGVQAEHQGFLPLVVFGIPRHTHAELALVQRDEGFPLRHMGTRLLQAEQELVVRGLALCGLFVSRWGARSPKVAFQVRNQVHYCSSLVNGLRIVRRLRGRNAAPPFAFVRTAKIRNISPESKCFGEESRTVSHTF